MFYQTQNIPLIRFIRMGTKIFNIGEIESIVTDSSNFHDYVVIITLKSKNTYEIDFDEEKEFNEFFEKLTKELIGEKE